MCLSTRLALAPTASGETWALVLWASWDEPPGGPGYSVRVWCWDPEAGCGGALGLSSGALNHPRVGVSIVFECVLLSPKQLHLRERRGARVGPRIELELERWLGSRWVGAGDRHGWGQQLGLEPEEGWEGLG